MQLGPRRFFFAGQRVVHASELIRSDVHFQNLAPRAEAPPAATDWSEPWHNILHMWDEKASISDMWWAEVSWEQLKLYNHRYANRLEPSWKPRSNWDSKNLNR